MLYATPSWTMKKCFVPVTMSSGFLRCAKVVSEPHEMALTIPRTPRFATARARLRTVSRSCAVCHQRYPRFAEHVREITTFRAT